MSKTIFLYKEKIEGYDCCVYIEMPELCDNIFSRLELCGTCFYGRDLDDYENIRTVLTKEEYQVLMDWDKMQDCTNMSSEFCGKIRLVLDKLVGDEGRNFSKDIMAEEVEYLMDEYAFDIEDIDDIFDNYRLDYFDRGVVVCVYDDVEDLAWGEVENIGVFSNYSIFTNYFDFRAFGEDLVRDDERYCELADGRIVCLGY